MKRVVLLSSALGLALSVSTAVAESYQIDDSHTTVGFSIRHMGISNVPGQFSDFSGAIDFDGTDTASLKAKATIQATSIDTRNQKRDDHLRNDDFFAVETHPEITFTSTGVEKSGEKVVLKGELTIRGVTKEVALDAVVSGPIDDPWGNKRLGLALSTTIARHDFGVGNDKASDKLIGKDVKIEINLEAVKKSS